jgi:hypothetical protein
VGKRTAARKNDAQVVGTRKLVNSQSSPRSWERESGAVAVQGFAFPCPLCGAGTNFFCPAEHRETEKSW